MVKGWVISVFMIVVWVAAQLSLFHGRHPRQLFRTMTFLFIPSLPVYAAGYLLMPPDLGFLPKGLVQGPPLLGLLNGLMLHLLLYATYVACFYYIERPLTLRILIALLQDPQRKWTLSEIKTVYRLGYLIRRRLEAMETGGLLTKRGEKYFLTPKGRRVGQWLYRGRTFLKICRSSKEMRLPNR